MLQAGEKARLEVVREADFGYFLSDGETDILLHHQEAAEGIKIGDHIEVFLYHDSRNRLTATCMEPILMYGEMGWLEVKEAEPSLGVFLDNGISKDLLLPKDELPTLRERWPKPGFKVFVKVERDRQGRMLCSLGKEDEILTVAKKGDPSLHNQELEGRVYHEVQIGAFILTTEGYMGLIHRDEMTTPLALGQRVKARVTRVREDGRLNLSMKPRKEVSYIIDAEMILTYLQQRGGRMPYGDHTAPDIIQEKFQMSKGAFKRALGKLIKEGKIVQENGWTNLIEKD